MKRDDVHNIYDNTNLNINIVNLIKKNDEQRKEFLKAVINKKRSEYSEHGKKDNFEINLEDIKIPKHIVDYILNILVKILYINIFQKIFISFK